MTDASRAAWHRALNPGDHWVTRTPPTRTIKIMTVDGVRYAYTRTVHADGTTGPITRILQSGLRARYTPQDTPDA